MQSEEQDQNNATGEDTHSIQNLVTALIHKANQHQEDVLKKKRNSTPKTPRVITEASINDGGYGTETPAEIASRRRYSDAERNTIIGIFEKYEVKEAAIAMIRSVESFEKVDRNMVKRWMKPKSGPPKKFGRPVSAEFEATVLQRCIDELKESSNYLDDNSAYSYAIIRKCATDVINTSYLDENGEPVYKWQNDDLTRNLKFSNKWINGFLKRVNKHKTELSEFVHQDQDGGDIHMMYGNEVDENGNMINGDNNSNNNNNNEIEIVQEIQQEEEDVQDMKRKKTSRKNR